MNFFNKLMLIILIILLTACDNKPEYRTIERMDMICDASLMGKQADFVLQCIKNANPRSDEEPEDWIMQCNAMSKDVYCTRTEVIVDQVKLPGKWWSDVRIKRNN